MSTPSIGNEPEGTRRPHVLVVDDTRGDRLVLTYLLQRSHVRVTAVEGVKEALEFLDSQNDVNMIVSDYCMPEMNGYDLLMEVKNSPPLAHIPVVIASSDNIPERIQKCLDGGAKEYIVKPVQIPDVLRILRYI
ncbi:two-component response regulator ORR12 [Brachypodium distachyon]|uniref:Response regulatory domain-containing protein n=1 Tax=Brachypodium distachyon TaxID=15368 RepID=I1HX06_BRADI|nr:two-component response regulator ORR12 [Brachypodium distachyon]KQJ93228.1 hypothetical protein BRADI_3g03295v3 [Brachypodium distachyon]|eukprot:XP_003570898.1 two-component response regulator ORR12 [Brachypodium distachyon]